MKRIHRINKFSLTFTHAAVCTVQPTVAGPEGGGPNLSEMLQKFRRPSLSTIDALEVGRRRSAVEPSHQRLDNSALTQYLGP
jgi:hypothetical protein